MANRLVVCLCLVGAGACLAPAQDRDHPKKELLALFSDKAREKMVTDYLRKPATAKELLRQKVEAAKENVKIRLAFVEVGLRSPDEFLFRAVDSLLEAQLAAADKQEEKVAALEAAWATAKTLEDIWKRQEETGRGAPERHLEVRLQRLDYEYRWLQAREEMSAQSTPRLTPPTRGRFFFRLPMRLALNLIIWIPLCSLAMGLPAAQGRGPAHLYVGLGIGAAIGTLVGIWFGRPGGGAMGDFFGGRGDGRGAGAEPVHRIGHTMHTEPIADIRAAYMLL